MCYLSGRSITSWNECSVELVFTKHEFYEKTVHSNPQNSAVEQENTVDVLEHGDNQMLTNYHLTKIVELPFIFPFYEEPFDEITVFANGYIELRNNHLDKTSDASKAEIAAFKTEANDLPSNVSISYGWNQEKFALLWTYNNKPLSFEVLLHKSGIIIMKYFHVPSPVDEHVFVGIGRIFEDIVNKTKAYRINTLKEHIQNGLTIKYDPVEDTCHENANSCSSCLQRKDCSWCKGHCQFSYKFCERVNELPANCSELARVRTTQKNRTLTTVCLILFFVLAMALIFYALFKFAVRHPASCPGQVNGNSQVLLEAPLFTWSIFHRF